MEHRATRDPLTGATNRQAFQAVAKLELDRAQRNGAPSAFALLDIDHFQQFNDTYGNETGDDVLKVLVERLRSCVRRPDFLVRLGGEKFGILLPNTDEQGLAAVAKRASAAIAERPFPTRSGPLRVRVSVGGVAALVPVGHFDKLYHAADQALHQAKENGQDRVVLIALGNSNHFALGRAACANRADPPPSPLVSPSRPQAGSPRPRAQPGSRRPSARRPWPGARRRARPR